MISSGKKISGLKKKKKHKRRKEKKKKIDSGLVSCFGRIGVPARSVNFFGLVTNAQLIRSSTSIIVWQLIRLNVEIVLYQPYRV